MPIYRPINFEQVVSLLSWLNNDGFDVVKTEKLYEFYRKKGFSPGQRE